MELDSNEQYSFKRAGVQPALLSVTIPVINRHSVYIAIHPYISSGGRTRTDDLKVMSLTSYQLLYPAMLVTPDGLEPSTP